MDLHHGSTVAFRHLPKDTLLCYDYSGPTMSSLLNRIKGYFEEGLWTVDLSSVGRLRVLAIRLLRLLYLLARELADEQLSMRAMSLVYVALLSFVPLLAVSFSVVKALGVHAKMEILLYNFLEPLGEKGIDLSFRIIQFVENVKAGVLGSIGLVLLMYTIVSQIQKIESALNYLWNVKGTRSFTRRFSSYLSVVLVGPVLFFSGVGVAASFMSSSFVRQLLALEPFGTVLYLAGKLMPFFLITATFTFIYTFLPNTKVRFVPALVGGLFAGGAWVAAGWALTAFVISSAQYSAIYSGFAVLILFLIWLYWSFLVLLAGARVSFYVQHPHYLTVRADTPAFSGRLREKLAVTIMYLVGHSFHEGNRPWNLGSFEEHLGLPATPLREVLDVLEKAGLVVRTNSEPSSYLPGKDIDAISLKEVLDAVRGAGEGPRSSEYRFAAPTQVDDMMERLDDLTGNVLGKVTVKSLLRPDK